MTDIEKLAIIWEERLIERRLLKFGRCLDLADWAGWRACFTDVIGVNFKRLTGREEVRLDADLWVAFVDRALTPIRRHHTYSNFDITLDGDHAHAVVYMTARHWASTDLGVSHNTQYGWYDFYLVRLSDGWRIERYKHDFQWIDGNAGILDVHDPSLHDLTNKIFTEEHFQAAKAAFAS